MVIKRQNPAGLMFFLHTLCEDRNKTEVHFNGKVLVFDAPLERLSQSWYDWCIRDQYIQDAFDYLTPDEREFLMTGITAKEWDEIFPVDDEREEKEKNDSNQ